MEARDKVAEAIEHEEIGRPALAQHALHSVLLGVIADSSEDAQMVEQATVVLGPASATLIAARTPMVAWALR